ncbi:MAG: hypothetical protein IJQ31_09475 [Thermoguttaceae bacterium]|nr:hypothetical protein [Thermoguttaceae bacterium]
MSMNKKSRMASAALVVLGVSLLASSANAGMPPSRQTPVIVPSDKRGVVEVGPCQLPPCVGGVTCTPNARDYGYYESTWRQWPTQQRYDQKFPEALNSYPINQKKSAISTTEAVSAPNPASNMLESLKKKQGDSNSITIPDDPEPTPAMGNFEGLSPVPSTTIITEPAQKVDPLLDYSKNSVPGISTAPAISNTPDNSSNLMPFPTSEPTPAAAPALESAPAPVPAEAPALEEAPAPAAAPALEEAPAPAAAPALEEAPAAAPALDAAPVSDDTELTPPTPKEDSPLIEPSEKADDSLSLPLSKGSQNEEHSIIVSKRDRGINPYDQATDPYLAAIQVSHEEKIPASHEEKVQVSKEEKSVETLNPFQTAVIPSEVVNAAPAVQNVQETVPAPATPEMTLESKKVGLEGFCPVTLLETEEWVEGKEEWTVMNHGVTYHLANAGQVQKFLADPDAYTPVMDGADPVLFTETGMKTPGNADHCVVFEGKLFMFANEENLNKFFTNSALYLKGIQNK